MFCKKGNTSLPPSVLPTDDQLRVGPAPGAMVDPFSVPPGMHAAIVNHEKGGGLGFPPDDDDDCRGAD